MPQFVVKLWWPWLLWAVFGFNTEVSMKHYLEDHEYNFLKKVSFILTKS